ncbi:uncharacterized protein BCR38DRAFT_491532 [Pseudomassariella vexata]|uniref:Uncharacterized protein n=1 Tax=Pseudomassariella vexata TaxID=1141098 RepID=A0A1Y2EH49_9PEZI|nr:uncharacterized protein BCR38DRAFT_491532 [Pseudomassariella vexata]ORY70898.1 hypothetical protein BCR38DRAFT_491532 [Pseudomassariella vexata]
MGLVHWFGSAEMLGWLVAGLLFAVGHHLFYSNLAGHEAPTGSYALGALSYSKQEAFFSNTSLELAMGIAYFQLFWQPAVDGWPTNLDDLDITYSVLDNMLQLFRFKIWWNDLWHGRWRSSSG